MAPARRGARDARRDGDWKPAAFVVGLLFIGYGGKYFGMVPTYVVRPIVRKDLAISIEHWDDSVAVAYLCYAAAKFVFGPLTDRVGGRKVFLGCLLGMSVTTFLESTIQTKWAFTTVWILLMTVSAPIWVALMKIAAAWIPSGKEGKMMAVLSLCYLVDDVLVRSTTGGLVAAGWSWRAVLAFCAFATVACAVPSFLLLRNTPADPLPALGRRLCPCLRGDGAHTLRRSMGKARDSEFSAMSAALAREAVATADDDEPPNNNNTEPNSAGGESVDSAVSAHSNERMLPAVVGGDFLGDDDGGRGADDDRQKTPCELLGYRPFLLTVIFYAIAYMTREFFTNYNVAYLATQWCAGGTRGDAAEGGGAIARDAAKDVAACAASKEATSAAALGSTVFSIAGACSTLFCGFMKDRLTKRGCIAMCGGLAAVTFGCVFLFASVGASMGYGTAVVLLVASGFGLIGPYSLCSGAFVIDFGGKKSSATASALMDGSGALFAFVIMILKGSFIGGGVSGIARGFGVLSAMNAVAVLLMVWLYKLVPPPGRTPRYAEDAPEPYTLEMVQGEEEEGEVAVI